MTADEVVPLVELQDGTVADIELTRTQALADPDRTFAATVLVTDAEGSYAVVYSVRRGEWGPPGGWREAGESAADCARREVAEEIGIHLDAGDLRPFGWERFVVRTAGPLAQPGRDLLQVYTATLALVRPPLTPQLDDTSARDWVDRAEFERRCGHQFWWPLVAQTVANHTRP